MSGYLEVKYPFKSNLGLNPFKSWKRQWCILRPSPTFSGGILAVYCSEAGASAGTIDLPSGFVVRRTKSRTRPHAFAVFPADDPRKPRVLLAANSPHDAQMWMEKIKAIIDGNKLLEIEGTIKDSFSVTVSSTELSRKCGLNGADSTVSVTSNGVLVSHSQKQVLVQWKHVGDASLTSENGDRNGTCILTVDSGFPQGPGQLHFKSPLAAALTAALQKASQCGGLAHKHLSKSDSHLNKTKCCDIQLGKVRRSSCCSPPAEVSLDDLDLVMFKECSQSRLSRYTGAGHLAADNTDHPVSLASVASCDHSMSDRRSLVSIESGIYEEIPDCPTSDAATTAVFRNINRDPTTSSLKLPHLEPTYESVSDCVYATLRRHPPPPLPPRDNYTVTRHGSLGWLPGGQGAGAGGQGGQGAGAGGQGAGVGAARTLPRWDRSRQAFSAFRKRLKSDSRATCSPKSETSKEKDVETKKKKFDFTPTRDIFKSFKVSRKMKNLKIAPGSLTKGETKSCEFLDETEHVTANRCSKSVECLDGNDEFLDQFDADLSLEYDHSISALPLPQEIVDLILIGHDTFTQISLSSIPYSGGQEEGVYMPMSPIIPPPLEHDYIAMTPRTNTA